MRINLGETVYSNKNLSIRFDEEYSIFTQDWGNDNNLTIDEFKTELFEFKRLFKKHRVINTIWLQEGFQLDLKPEDHAWIEENINIPCKSYGLEKVAFVVGKDVTAHLSVFNYFEEFVSCITPKHFAGEIEATNWIIKDVFAKIDTNINAKIEIQFLGKSENGKSRYTLEANSEDTEATLKSFKYIVQENKFLKENAERFYSLTQREKEVFEFYANGTTLKEIADKLFLSEFTVRTHWRNIKKKLKIQNLSDIVDYRNSFLR